MSSPKKDVASDLFCRSLHGNNFVSIEVNTFSREESLFMLLHSNEDKTGHETKTIKFGEENIRAQKQNRKKLDLKQRDKERRSGASE